MATLNFKVSLESIRKANNMLISKGVDFSARTNYNGNITTKTIVDGSVKIREISKEEIKDAYGKALRKYGEKL